MRILMRRLAGFSDAEGEIQYDQKSTAVIQPLMGDFSYCARTKPRMVVTPRLRARSPPSIGTPREFCSP